MTPRVSVPVALLLILTAGSLAFFIYGGQFFPPRMAVHFDSAGVPDGWMDRLKFIVIASSMSFMLPPLVVACVGVMPRVLPSHMLNLRNREYWLAPKRREETLQLLLYFALWLGCLVQALLIAVSLTIARANPQSGPGRLDGGPAILAAAFIAGLVLWAVMFARAFSLRTRA